MAASAVNDIGLSIGGAYPSSRVLQLLPAVGATEASLTLEIRPALDIPAGDALQLEVMLQAGNGSRWVTLNLPEGTPHLSVGGLAPGNPPRAVALPAESLSRFAFVQVYYELVPDAPDTSQGSVVFSATLNLQ